MSVQKSSFLLREIDIFRPFLKSTSMWLKMAPCLAKIGLTRPREASRWLQIDPGGSKMVALQFRPMLFTESFLPSVTSDLQCCCSSTPRTRTTVIPLLIVYFSFINVKTASSREHEILPFDNPGLLLLSLDASSSVAKLLSSSPFR